MKGPQYGGQQKLVIINNLILPCFSTTRFYLLITFTIQRPYICTENKEYLVESVMLTISFHKIHLLRQFLLFKGDAGSTISSIYDASSILRLFW